MHSKWNSYTNKDLWIKNVNMTACIPSSSLMVTVVDESVADILGPVGVTVERLTVNS